MMLMEHYIGKGWVGYDLMHKVFDDFFSVSNYHHKACRDG